MSTAGGRPAAPAGLDLETYFREIRRVSVSLWFVAGLAAAHQALVWTCGEGVRNAAEQALRSVLGLSGAGPTYAALLVTAVLLAAAVRLSSRRVPALRFAAPLLAESLLYALLLGPVVSFAVGRFWLSAPPPAAAPDSLWAGIVASLGAGLYEELLFRMGALGGLHVLLYRGFGWSRPAALAAALLVSSAAFSLYHHIGPGAEPFALRIAAFRLGAGILLGGLFAWRGLAVVVYAHALYDVLHQLDATAWLS